MAKIGGSGRPPRRQTDGEVGKKVVSERSRRADVGPQEKAETLRKAAGKKVLDSVERAAPSLQRQLQKVAGKAPAGMIANGAGQIRFTSEHLAHLAAVFAGVLRKDPRAERRERARMFARAVLTSKRLARLFEGADERDLEAMFDTIAKQLDSSPRLAQLVDEVTEGARKMNLG